MLYGQGSMKKLSAASSEAEKQRHTLERRKEELVRNDSYNFSSRNSLCFSIFLRIIIYNIIYTI